MYILRRDLLLSNHASETSVGIFRNQPFPGGERSIYHLLASLKYIMGGRSELDFISSVLPGVHSTVVMVYNHTAAYTDNKSQGNINTSYFTSYLYTNTTINFIPKNMFR